MPKKRKSTKENRLISNMHMVSFSLNGKKVSVVVKPAAVLLDVIRDNFNLKGTKPGCHEGECGACTVLVNGNAVNSCLFLAVNANGKEITTIEGLTRPDGTLDSVQEKLVENGAVQCGFCTSGMAMSIKALENHYNNHKGVQGALKNGSPSRDEIKKWLEGNLCRVTGYIKIIDAAEKLLTNED